MTSRLGEEDCKLRALTKTPRAGAVGKLEGEKDDVDVAADGGGGGGGAGGGPWWK